MLSEGFTSEDREKLGQMHEAINWLKDSHKALSKSLCDKHKNHETRILRLERTTLIIIYAGVLLIATLAPRILPVLRGI